MRIAVWHHVVLRGAWHNTSHVSHAQLVPVCRLHVELQGMERGRSTVEPWSHAENTQ